MANSKDFESNAEKIEKIKNLMKPTCNESKKNSNIEYEKIGADGKKYGIIREGTKYYIKYVPNTNGVLAEKYDYIGGFRERKNNEFSSFNDAQKRFDLHMMSLKEAANDKSFVADSWNFKQGQSADSDKALEMRKEILREQQIIYNSERIGKGKNQNMDCINAPYCEKPAAATATKVDKIELGDPTKANKECTEAPKANKEKAEPLKSEPKVGDNIGTKVGDSAPYDVVPQKIKEAVDDEASIDVDNDDDVSDDDIKALSDEDGEDGEAVDDDDEGIDDGDEIEGSDDEMNQEEEEEENSLSDIKSQISDLNAKINTILDTLQASNADDNDDDLYADGEDEADDEGDEDEEDIDDAVVYESKAYRLAKMREENEFGKHPAYQKAPMTTPQADDTKPFGTQKGDSTPFTITPQEENQMVEYIIRKINGRLKKKK